MFLVTTDGFVKSSPIECIHAEQNHLQKEAKSVLVRPSSFLNQEIPWLLKFDRIIIEFESSSDGRGFSLAKRIRALGYKAKIRARGNMFCEQYRYLLDCGFDEVEITPEQAQRQPFHHWVSRELPSYRDKLIYSAKNS